MKNKNTVLADYQAILRLSPRLQLFSKVDSSQFNFRCPVCGDSKKNQYKKRGYFIKATNNQNWFFLCYNCDHTSSVQYFLKQYFPDQYKEYMLSIVKNDIYSTKTTKTTKIPSNPSDDILHKLKKTLIPVSIGNSFTYNSAYLKRFTGLEENHPARKYVTHRGILKEDIWYCTNFTEYLRRLDDNKKYTNLYGTDYKKKCNAIPRLIIPFWDINGVSQVQQARCFGNESLRYITLKKQEDTKKIYGLNKVDFNKTIYITEGPIDSMFLYNAIGMGGASISNLPEGDYVYVYDVEKRNKQISKIVKKTIQKGFKVFIPDHNWYWKDLNEAYMAGKSREWINKYIESRVFQGMRARLEVNK